MDQTKINTKPLNKSCYCENEIVEFLKNFQANDEADVLDLLYEVKKMYLNNVIFSPSLTKTLKYVLKEILLGSLNYKLSLTLVSIYLEKDFEIKDLVEIYYYISIINCINKVTTTTLKKNIGLSLLNTEFVMSFSLLNISFNLFEELINFIIELDEKDGLKDYLEEVNLINAREILLIYISGTTSNLNETVNYIKVLSIVKNETIQFTTIILNMISKKEDNWNQQDLIQAIKIVDFLILILAIITLSSVYE